MMLSFVPMTHRFHDAACLPHPHSFAFFPNPCYVFNFVPGRRAPVEEENNDGVHELLYYFLVTATLKSNERHLNSEKNDYCSRLTSKHEIYAFVLRSMNSWLSL